LERAICRPLRHTEAIAWAIQHHQALRYFADPDVGYEYPEARQHRWYMTCGLITIYDIYSFEENREIDPETFTDIIGGTSSRRRTGFDNSPVAHMWRTMI
jgi:hypothetical protein